MASDTKANHKAKDEESNDSKGRNIGSRSSSSLGTVSDTPGLRRSARDTSLKKKLTPSPSSTRKRERLEKCPPTTPTVMRKSERLIEKTILSSPLRRSLRGAKKQSLSSSSGSKKSSKSSGSSAMEKEQKKEKSLKQLEMKEVGNSDKHATEALLVEAKRMDARAYRELFKRQPKKANLEGRCEETKKKNTNGNDGRDDGSENVDGSDDTVALSSHETLSELENNVAETEQKNLQAETPGLDTEVEGGYKVGLILGLMAFKQKRSFDDMNSDAATMVSNKDADAAPYKCDRTDSVEKCATSSKRQRGNHQSNPQEHCSCNPNFSEDSCDSFVPKGRGRIEANDTAGLAEQCITDLQHKKSSLDPQFDFDANTCLICKRGGKLLCCEGQGCKRSYHLSCLDPPLEDIPLGVWHCLACVRKKMESGMHSVSEGIESIWDAREVEVADDNGMQKRKQFYVKYKGLAHVHNRWLPENQLLLEAPSLLGKFNQKKQVTKWKKEWTVPHRMLQKQSLMSPNQSEENCRGHASNVLACHFEWLVKWRGLDYEHATWELETGSFMNSPEAQSLMRDYENRHAKSKQAECLSTMDKLSAGVLPEFNNNHLDLVNNLREYWHKGENAVLIDEQEQIRKVISFILSLSSNASWPFLIITTSAALHSWEEELSRLAPSLYAVVYHGNKDIQRSIRKLEFYNEGGCIMFQILITSPEVIIEDLNVLDSMKWEAIVVDECQCSRMYSHFEHIKVLSTAMKLLLVNGQLTDGLTEHLLSLLVHQSDLKESEGLVTNMSPETDNLKESLSKYIANACKPGSSRLAEYWVPVQLSPMQLEQYCATLLSNSLSLCSPLKTDLVDALRDILISSRKCCDHPYIVDPSLQIPLMRDSNVNELLDIGIKASGKLHVLDEMLSSIKERGLRVLVLFQSSGGFGKDNIGDILEDVVRQRFGKGSYERVDEHVAPSRKQAALNNFNNHQEGRFVFLLETRACGPSIKLSSVDTVIIFASNWNPMTEIRNLQKIKLHSQFAQINVFRLYSSYTVEEKVLIIARQGKTLDSKHCISRGASHMLLMWGASHLFDKLSEFQCGNDPALSGNALFEQTHLKDVIQEFLTIISQKGKAKTPSNSVILKVQQNQGSYTCSFPLHGERNIQLLDEKLPHIFWRKLLKGKQPQWKHSSGLSPRNRKRVNYIDDTQKKSEVEGDEVVKKRNKVAINNTDSPSLKASLIGTCGAPMHNMSQSMSSSTGRLNTNDANHISNLSHLNSNLSEVLEANMVGYNERMNLDDSGKSLYLLLKPEIANLCEILQFPENVKVMVERFLDYVLNNHHISREPASTLRAFLISLCWTAASMLKHKLDHKESLARAKQHLNFDCKKDEADFVYSKLRCLKKVFLYRIGASKVAASPKTGEFSNEVLSKNQSNGKSSLSTPSNTKKVRIEVESLRSSQEFSVDQVLSHLGLAQKDYTKSIEDIKKKCDKQMRKLLQKQEEERKELERKYEEEKADIEYMHRTEAAIIRLHSNVTVRTDELKLLNNQLAKELVEVKRKMDIRLTNLLEWQVATRNNLKEKKAQWIERVNSWVHAELLNKSPVNESGCNQEIASKEQTPKRAHSTPDGEVPPEVPETVSSNEDVLPAVVAISEPVSDEATSSMRDREIPLEVPQAASMREVSEDVVYLNSSFEEQIPDEQIPSRVPEANSSSDCPEREFPLEVTGTLSSTGALENAAFLNPSPNQHVEVDPSRVHETPCEVGGSGIIDREDGGVCVAALSYSTGVDQHAGVLPSGGFETATGADVGCDHTRQEIDRTHAAASDNNQPTDQHVVQMPVSMSQDPLQNELDRICKEIDQIIKIHEDSKLQVKSVCEKEIQEAIVDIRRKHDTKLQEMESEFLRKKQEIDENQNKVLMNKILAEAFRTKCMDNKASTPVRQQEMTSSIVQQLLQLSQSTTQRPSVVVGPNSTSLTTASLQTTPSSSSSAPQIQAVHHPRLFTGTPTRPPRIGSISPTTCNLQVGSEIRAPAPHLQQFRPSTFATTSLSSFPRGMQSQVSTTLPTLCDILSRAPPTISDIETPTTVQQSGTQATTICVDSMGNSFFRSFLQDYSPSIDVDNQTSANAMASGQTNQSSEIVCLSDDD